MEGENTGKRERDARSGGEKEIEKEREWRLTERLRELEGLWPFVNNNGH